MGGLKIINKNKYYIDDLTAENWDRIGGASAGRPCVLDCQKMINAVRYLLRLSSLVGMTRWLYSGRHQKMWVEV